MKMKYLKKWVRTTSIVLASGFASFFLLLSSARADDFSVMLYLKQISDYTYGTLQAVNGLPNLLKIYLEDVKKMAQSFNKLDDDPDKGISIFQSQFSTLNKEYKTNLESQISLDMALTENFLRAGLPAVSSKPPVEEEIEPNSLSYSILSGKPIFATSQADKAKVSGKMEEYARNYIANLSGSKLVIKQPVPGIPSEARMAYRAFYNSLAAIQSYNAFAISSLYTQRDNKTRTALLDLTNDSEKWFQQIASEDLGMVLRQMLMFNSQVFVQLDRLITLQQQQLAAQAMTNTLLVIQTSGTIGETLRSRASGAT